MKKTIALSATAAMIMSCAVCAHAAGQTKVTVSDGNIREVSFVNDTMDAASEKINRVLYTLDELKLEHAKAKQNFNVMTEVESDVPVDVTLRLATESSSVTAQADATAVLRTYDIVVKNGDEVIFDTDNTELEVVSPTKGEFYADIYLGRFNETELAEVNTYTIELEVPSGVNTAEVKKAQHIDWEIVADPVEEGATPVPTAEPTEEPTQAPQRTAAPAAPVTTAAPASTPEATDADATADPAGTDEPVKTTGTGEKTVGTGKDEVKPGVYVASARETNANIKIYNATGEIVQEVDINKISPQVLLDLKQGQKIVYEGGVNLKPYAVPTAAPKQKSDGEDPEASTTKKSTSTTKTGSTAKTADTAKTAANVAKTNPKTGDAAPIAGLSIVAVFALGMLAYPEIEKRRKNNN